MNRKIIAIILIINLNINTIIPTDSFLSPKLQTNQIALPNQTEIQKQELEKILEEMQKRIDLSLVPKEDLEFYEIDKEKKDGWVDYVKYVKYKQAGYRGLDIAKINGMTLARIDTIIERQATGVGTNIGELISNGLDAMSEEAIGRFGFGFNQIFQELEDEEDRVIVWTQNFRIIFKKAGEEILFKLERMEMTRKGTRVEVKKYKKIAREKQEEIAEMIRKKYGFNEVARVNLFVDGKGEIVNGLEERYKNNDGRVNVVIREDGYIVDDLGKGMDEKIILESLLSPRHTTKKISRGGENLKFRVRGRNQLGECEISILVSGVRVQGYRLEGVNLPRELGVDLGYDIDMGADRSRININEKVVESLKILTRKALNLRTKERYQILNGIVALIREMSEEIREINPVVYSELLNLKQTIKEEMKKKANTGKVKFFISRIGMEKLKIAEEPDIEFIDRDLYEIDMLTQGNFLKGLERIEEELYASYHGYKLYIADFKDKGKAYLDIDLGSRGGVIIIDRKIYERFRESPEILNMLINQWIGYGKKPKKKVEIKKRERKEEKSAKKEENEELQLKIDGILSIKEIRQFGKDFYLFDNEYPTSGLFVLKQDTMEWERVEEIEGSIGYEKQQVGEDIYIKTDKGLYIKRQGRDKFEKIKIGEDIKLVYFGENIYVVNRNNGNLYLKKEGSNDFKQVGEIGTDFDFRFKQIGEDIYIGSDDGLYIQRQGRGRFEKVIELEDRIIIFEKVGEDIYLATVSGNIYLKKQDSYGFEQLKTIKIDGNVKSINQEGKNIYMGTTKALYVKKGDTFEKVQEVECFGHQKFRKLREDIYIVFSAMVKSVIYIKKKDSEVFEKVVEIEGQISEIEEIGEDIYMITSEGLYVKNGDKFEKADVSREIKVNPKEKIGEDIYVRTSEGLFIKKQGFDDFEKIGKVALFGLKQVGEYVFAQTYDNFYILKKGETRFRKFVFDGRHFFTFAGLTKENKEKIERYILEFRNLEGIDEVYKKDFSYYLTEYGLPKGINLEENRNKYMLAILGRDIEAINIEFVEQNKDFFENFAKSKLFWQLFKKVYKGKDVKLVMERLKYLVDQDFGLAESYLLKTDEELEEELKIFLTEKELNLEEMQYEEEELGVGEIKLETMPLGRLLTLKARTDRRINLEGLLDESAPENTSYKSVISGQNIDKGVFVRELVQNSRDAYQERAGIINIKSGFEKKSRGLYYVVSVEDNVGMDIEQVLNDLLIPDESTKVGTGSTGFFGIGFFTTFQEADEVIVRTGKGTGKSWEIELKVIRKENGELESIVISKITEYEDKFKGTRIEVKKQVRSKIIGYIENMGLKSRVEKYVGRVENLRLNRESVKEDREEILEINGLKLTLRKHKKGGYVEQNGLFVCPLDKRLLKYVAKEFLESLEKEELDRLVIEIPRDMRLTSSRGVVMEEEEELEKMIAMAIYKWLVKEYLQNAKRLYGLSQDYFWESGTTVYEPTQQIRKDAEKLNEGKSSEVNFDKYLKNPKYLISLLTLIKDPISGKSIREIKLALEERKRKGRESGEEIGEGVLDGVLSLVGVNKEVLGGIVSEYKYREKSKIQEVQIPEEAYILKNFLEAMTRELGFGFVNVGFKTGGGSAANYKPKYDAKRGKIYWDIEFDIKVCEKFLERIRRGEDVWEMFYDGSMDSFFRVYWHEWTHTREYENVLNARLAKAKSEQEKQEIIEDWLKYFTDEIMKDQIMQEELKNMTSHQSEKSLKGGFAEIMDRELQRFVRGLAGIDIDRMLEEARDMGRLEYLFTKEEGILEKIVKMFENTELLEINFKSLRKMKCSA